MKSQHRLASEWETCARNYRAQAETLLSNRAEMAEKESLLWRARAYESCAEELRLNEAPQTGNPPPDVLLKRLQTARIAFGGATTVRRENGTYMREMDDEEWDKWCDELKAIEMALRGNL